MVTLGLLVQPERAKTGHRRIGCSLARLGLIFQIMESATENKPPSGKGETVV